ncbi:unnamed protein product [Diamesa hyperborea]
MFKLNYFLICLVLTHFVVINCGILDFLSLSGDDDTPQKRERENDCLCTGQIAKDHSCICCLDFNVSETFDLGPACVRMKYLSQSEGVALNLTVGKSLVKTAKVNASNPDQSVCLSMFGSVAKICARFNGLIKSANDGLVGCLQIQPKVFGQVPIDFDFPCFEFADAQEIKIIDAPKVDPVEEDKDEETEVVEATTNGTDTIAGFKVEDILNVVSKTADRGISIIQGWLGLDDDATDDDTATKNVDDEDEEADADAPQSKEAKTSKNATIS